MAPEILIKNSEQIFSLEEFLEGPKTKLSLFKVCFNHCYSNVKKKKTIANKTLVNRVVAMYLDIGLNDQVERSDFIDFF